MSICCDCTTNCQSVVYRSYRCDHYRTFAIGLMEIAFLGIVRYIFKYFAKGVTLEIRAIRIADEIEIHETLFQHDFLDAQLFAKHAKGYDIDELFGYAGDGTETVDQAFAIGFEIIVEMIATSQIIKLAIEQHTLRGTGHILIGEVHLDIGFESTVIYPLSIEH